MIRVLAIRFPAEDSTVLHALSNVWQAVGLFEKDELRRRTVTHDRLTRILCGEVCGVTKGLRCLGTVEVRRHLVKDRMERN